MVCVSSVKHGEIVGELAASHHRIEPLRQRFVLGGDAGGIAALMPVVVGAGLSAELAVLVLEMRIVVADGDERCGTDRHRIGAERETLGDIGAGAHAARNDELDLAVHAKILQRPNRGRNGRKCRDADMLDEYFLRCRRTALHAVKHDRVGAGFYRERNVILRTRCANLDVDRLLPIGNFPQLEQLDLEVIRPGPVRMPGSRTLVDALRQRAHPGNALGNLLSQQHAAAARLGALADHDFDRVRPRRSSGFMP